jgi:hypothetical protein
MREKKHLFCFAITFCYVILTSLEYYGLVQQQKKQSSKKRFLIYFEEEKIQQHDKELHKCTLLRLCIRFKILNFQMTKFEIYAEIVSFRDLLMED